MGVNISLLLKERRQIAGLDLEQVSQVLKIRTKYLEAIEEDKDGLDIPSPVYMLGYLKNYADFLGLNGQSIINQLKSANYDVNHLNLPSPYTDDSKPSLVIIAISIILLAGFFVSWLKFKGEYDILNDKPSVLISLLKSNNDHSYLFSKYNKSNLVSAPTKIDLDSRASSDLYIILAKQPSRIKIINNKSANVISDINKNEIYQIPKKTNLMITINRGEVELFDMAKLFNTNFNTI